MDLTPKYGFNLPALDDLFWNEPTNENWEKTELLISGTEALASGTQSALASHIIDPNDAHPATAISYDNATSGLTATTAQDALDEAKNLIDTHDHDGTYAPLSHNHDGVYAGVVHNHDASYAPLVHDHDADYADINHDHDADYAPLSLVSDVAALSGTVAGKQDALGFTPENAANKGQPNGYASLGVDGKVPSAQIPADAFTGIQDINGLSGTSVTLDTDDVAEGSTNLYWTDARFDARLAASAVDAETLDGLNSSDFALTGHNHDGAYAAIGHDHDADYAPLSLVADVSAISGTVAGHTADISQLESDVAALQTGKQDALGYTPENQANRGVAGGYAPLGLDGKVPVSNLPAIAINETFVVNSEAEMIALTAERGDVAVRTDLNKSFILKTDDPTLATNWQELLTPTDAVTTVNGQSGNVVLTTTDIAEGTNLYFTNTRVQTFGDTRYLQLTGGSLSGSLTVNRASISNPILNGLVTGDTVNRFSIAADGGHTWGTGSATRDTFLQRTAVGQLSVTGGGGFLVDSFFRSTVLGSGDQAFNVRVSGDTQSRFELKGGGQMSWGPGGSSALDTSLVRTGVGALLMTVSGGLTVDGFIRAQRTAATAGALATRVNTDTNDRGFIRADGKIEWGDGTAARDTNLYRNGVNTLRTDGILSVGTSLSLGGPVFATVATASVAAYGHKVTGDTLPRWQVLGDGRLEWGSGSAAMDVNLYRSAANTLKTDDAFEAPSGKFTDTLTASNMTGGVTKSTSNTDSGFWYPLGTITLSATSARVHGQLLLNRDGGITGDVDINASAVVNFSVKQSVAMGDIPDTTLTMPFTDGGYYDADNVAIVVTQNDLSATVAKIYVKSEADFERHSYTFLNTRELGSSEFAVAVSDTLGSATLPSGTVFVPVTSISVDSTTGEVSAPSFVGSGIDLTGVEKTANKGVANGYASLDNDGLVPVSQLPAAATGGIQSVNGDSSANVVLDTDDIAEGATNLYYTDARVDARIATTAIDADTLDGMDSTAFATAGHNHDAAYVKKTDTSWAELFVVADLATNTGVTADYKINSGGIKNIGKVVISSLTATVAGIEIDIKIKETPSSTPVSIFTTTPTLDGVNGINWTSVTTGFALSEIPEDAMILLEIVSADGGSDLRVELYE